MSKLQVLHLSDLHLAGNRAYYERWRDYTNNFLSVYDPDALEAIGEIVYRWGNDLDAILISGDIAVTGTEKDINRATEFFTTPFSTEEPW